MWNKSFSRKEASSVAKIVAVANQKGGVGKTTTAVNLSSCVAALGKKVLIVDLDPQGNTTTGYGISKRSVDIGTYEILIGEADARQAVRKTEFRTDVIGSNTRLAGASLEMIDLPGRESRLRKALAPIQKDYDFIFIDCPPVDIVADAQIIEKLADRTIFVIRSGLLDRSMLSELETMYTGKRFKNLSMILNGTESTGGRYGYRYGYHYGYGSYYGGKGK